MRRWNGWGDSLVSRKLTDAAVTHLESLIGPGSVPVDATLDSVVASVPASRLGAHPFLSFDAESRVRHARGQSFPDWLALRCGRLPVVPDAVASPSDAEDVRELMVRARAWNARLIPFGGGTSVVGHVNPQAGDSPVITVDLQELSRLKDLAAGSQLATFGAGILGPDLEAHLRAAGFTLGHFPQSFEFSTLGGWIAARSSGQQSLGFGRIERLFAGGRLVSPAGTLDLPPFPASAAGLDLKEAVLGSEGRLGILTEATVRVTPLPSREEFPSVFFGSFEEGLDAARALAQARLPISMIRLATATETVTTLTLARPSRSLDLFERYLAFRGAAEGKSLLILALAGSDRVVRFARAELLRITSQHGGLVGPAALGRHWQKNRFLGPYLRNALWERGYGVDTFETAADWSRVPPLLAGIEESLRTALVPFGERTHAFTHLSHVYPTGSSLYTTVIFRLAKDPDETQMRWQAIKSGVCEAIVRHGGTISHQHGVGLDHRPYLGAEKGELGLRAIGELCRTFDPDGLMNPGKLIDA
ncbi:MAG: FAD-binding oxidoreductase [Thermoanaerobaculia bacterium]